MEKTLRELADKKTFDAFEKTYIRKASEKMSVPFNPKAKCPNCYKDQVMVLLAKIAEVKIAETPKKSISKDQFILKEGVDIIWRGIRVNAHTLTNEIARKMISDQLFKFFAFMPDDNK